MAIEIVDFPIKNGDSDMAMDQYLWKYNGYPIYNWLIPSGYVKHSYWKWL